MMRLREGLEFINGGIKMENRRLWTRVEIRAGGLLSAAIRKGMPSWAGLSQGKVLAGMVMGYWGAAPRSCTGIGNNKNRLILG